MGVVDKEEIIEEIETSPDIVFSVLTDLTIANAWGRVGDGFFLFPAEARLKLGHLIDFKPAGWKESLKLKVKVIRHDQVVQMDIVEGPMFGTLDIVIDPRPYGTLITTRLNYRIERVGFSLKWKLSDKKKYGDFMRNILLNIKRYSESRAPSS
ncbi:MAG: hypothetical protein QCI82_07620 [Candidatus Thermoplasmatota archaeon]|nr:hypothetical protein [Candidatus Thermoplasmatota archaeon]